MSKDLGRSTAYGYAVSKGYTGTEEEFAELMASYAHVAEDARASAETASNAKDDAVSAKNTAVTSAQTASAKASEAAQSAQNASTSASTASTKASEASASASNAQTSASTASTKATEAASSATSANSAKTDAVNAKNAAQTAQTASETARTAAEEAQASAEQAAQEAHDTLDKKAEIDGYYEEMTVGDAEQLVSSQFVTDSVPYLYRTTGGSADVGNREYMKSIVGGTVAWNQLVQNGDFANGTSQWYKATGNISASNGEAEVTIGGAWNNDIRQTRHIYNGHVYFMRFSAKADSALSGNARATFTAVAGTSITASTPMLTTSYQTREYIDKCRADQRDIRITLSDNASEYVGQKYYAKDVNLIDLTQMFGSTIADYIYSIEQANAGAGVAFFKKLFPKPYYAYDAGSLKSVEGLSEHKMTGFNQWDEEYQFGYYDANGVFHERTSQGEIASKNMIPVLPNTTYYFHIGTSVYRYVCYYDADGNIISQSGLGGSDTTFTTPSNCHYINFNAGANYGTTYNHDICINLSNSGYRDGEYEPYKKHSYALDSSLVLRGIPKLDANNKLYYDGDVYEADGTVTRRIKVLDVNGIGYSADQDTDDLWRLGARVYDFVVDNLQAGAINYVFSDASLVPYTYAGETALKTSHVCPYGHSNALEFRIWVSKADYPTVESALAYARSCTYLYLTATPTTEEAEPFQEVQICDDFGTEEFVTTSIVPVGHNTEYPANLRDKLQHLPNLADADGYYMIKQTNKQMSLEHFRIPKAPTEDGTYTLKATVSGGTPTYTWESETVENG